MACQRIATTGLADHGAGADGAGVAEALLCYDRIGRLSDTASNIHAGGAVQRYVGTGSTANDGDAARTCDVSARAAVPALRYCMRYPLEATRSTALVRSRAGRVARRRLRAVLLSCTPLLRAGAGVDPLPKRAALVDPA